MGQENLWQVERCLKGTGKREINEQKKKLDYRNQYLWKSWMYQEKNLGECEIWVGFKKYFYYIRKVAKNLLGRGNSLNKKPKARNQGCARQLLSQEDWRT